MKDEVLLEVRMKGKKIRKRKEIKGEKRKQNCEVIEGESTKCNGKERGK